MATRLAERVVEREQELREVRAEIVALRAAGDEGLRRWPRLRTTWRRFDARLGGRRRGCGCGRCGRRPS